MDTERLIALKQSIEVALSEANTPEPEIEGQLVRQLKQALRTLEGQHPGTALMASANAAEDFVVQAIQKALRTGKPPDRFPDSLADQAQLQEVISELVGLHEFVLCIAAGDLNHSLKMKGRIAGALKSLQAGLRHLTWQTQQIAQGDLSQRVDFMGDFSTAFNRMTDALADARAEMERQNEELRDAQEQLVRQEKLTVLGQLAGGVAHELRNPLAAIKNAAYFLNMVLEEPEPEVKETLEILGKEVATSERTISSLLDLARTKPPIRRKVNINEVVQEVLSSAAVPENVEVVSQLDGALPTILADPNQLVQVFGNIILNAVQAMPEGGQLVVGSKVSSPAWVAVSFADTGVGIAEESLGKVFEPLFTTKAKGIGLGLAVTRTLVEGHGGTMEVESEVGKGSTFTVKLPTNGRKEKRSMEGEANILTPTGSY
jgi:signal transduction histidine kinase